MQICKLLQLPVYNCAKKQRSKRLLMCKFANGSMILFKKEMGDCLALQMLLKLSCSCVYRKAAQIGHFYCSLSAAGGVNKQCFVPHPTMHCPRKVPPILHQNYAFSEPCGSVFGVSDPSAKRPHQKTLLQRFCQMTRQIRKCTILC